MGQLNEVDKTSLYYHKIHHLVEAYNIFYGKYPTFSNYEEEMKMKKDFQLMCIVLGEYDILNCQYGDYRYLDFDKDTEVVYSVMVDCMTDFLIKKLRKSYNQEEDLEALCSERPLEEKEREGIKAVSYVIKKQMEKENTENYVEFLEQLSNIIYYRERTIFKTEEDYDKKIEKMINYIIVEFKDLDYTYDMIKEKLEFICQKLYLIFNIACNKCNIQRVVIEVKEKNMDEYSSYSGIIGKPDQKTKVLKLDTNCDN